MAEDIVEQGDLTPTVDSGGTPSEALKPEPQQPEPEPEKGQEPEQPDKTVPYARFKEVNDARKALQTDMDDIKAEREQAKIDAKKEEGKYQELYEEMEGKFAQQQSANDQLRLDQLRKEVAQKAGFGFLWDRLRGETEDDLTSDLQTLIEEMPAPHAPSVDGAAGSGGRTPEAEPITEATRQEIAAKYGLPVWAIPDHIIE